MSLLNHAYGMLTLPVYLALTILIGWLVRRGSGTSGAYLNSSRSLPLPIVAAAYLAANCGALEIVGLSAMAAQYGVQAFHFYWIGAIPAMIFLSLWMMPVYRKSGIGTVPEYLDRRFGPRLRLLNASVLAITVLLLAGISLYALAQVLAVVIGISFPVGVLVSAGVVLLYVLLGGIRATIYNEVFQLAVMLAGLIPLAIRAVHLPPAETVRALPCIHLWANVPFFAPSATLDGFGIIFGLGFVLSFGYWCTDFVLMQRAFAARTDMDARKVPLLAGFGKLLFSLIVVLPGLAAARLLPAAGHVMRFDRVLPSMMMRLYGPGMLGVGLTALVASLMSSLAANVSAFATVVTDDLYRRLLRPHAPDLHYLRFGRWSTVVAVLISALASYLNFLFSNLMEHVQLIFSIFGAPFWAIFLLGMATRRANQRGALAGFLTGSGVALLHLAAAVSGHLHYGSLMNANFHGASYAFTSALAVGWLVSCVGTPSSSAVPRVLVFQWKAPFVGDGNRLLWILAVLLAGTCLVLNVQAW